MRFVGVGFISIVLLGAFAAVACGDDDATGAGNGNGATSGGPGTASGGPGGTNSSTSSSGSSTASSGALPPPTGDDHGLIPTSSVWRTTTEWYRPIDTAPLAEHSDEMIAALKTFGTQKLFQIDFSFNVLDGTGGAPATFPEDDEADPDPVPIPAKGYIEGDHPYDDCPGNEDCHLLILDPGANRLFEIVNAHHDGNSWDGEEAMWKLDKTYPRENRGKGCTSADAAGLPITPGLIGYQETKAGTIAHALRYIQENQYIRGVDGSKTTPNVVYPASHGSTKGNSLTGIPYGGRLRLKSNISENDPRVKTPGAKALVIALKKYGMILADGGNLPLVAESAKVYNDQNPSEKWDDILGPKDLDFLQPTDFEIVAIPKDNPSNLNAGWYSTKADYEAQLQTPLGCDVAVQPQ